jgi:hypothetical protein
MTIAPGALVMTRPTGTILWVVVAKADDVRRWRLRAKRVDWRGRSDVTCRVAGRRRSRPNQPGTHLLTRHHDRTHDEEPPESHAFASLRRPSRRILGKGIFSDGTE